MEIVLLVRDIKFFETHIDSMVKSNFLTIQILPNKATQIYVTFIHLFKIIITIIFNLSIQKCISPSDSASSKSQIHRI